MKSFVIKVNCTVIVSLVCLKVALLFNIHHCSFPLIPGPSNQNLSIPLPAQVYQGKEPPEDLVKNADSHLMQLRRGQILYLISSQEMLKLPVRGPHFKLQNPRQHQHLPEAPRITREEKGHALSVSLKFPSLFTSLTVISALFPDVLRGE